MIVLYRSDFPDAIRRAIRKRTGEGGLATRKEIVAWLDHIVMSITDTMLAEQKEEEENER